MAFPGLAGLFGNPSTGAAGMGATGALQNGTLVPPNADSIAKAAMLQSIDIAPSDIPNPPQSPLVNQPSAQNPELSRMLLQAMMGTMGQLPPSLGSILGGRV